jgi:hypothetical protein
MRRAKTAKGRATSDQQSCRRLTPFRKHPWLLAAIIVFGLAVATTLRVYELSADPHVYFLSNEGSAEWIRADVPFWCPIEMAN